MGGSVRNSADLSDFPRADARRASIKRFVRAIHYGPHAPEVGIPSAPRDVVRVTDAVSIFGTFSAKVAHASHNTSH